MKNLKWILGIFILIGISSCKKAPIKIKEGTLKEIAEQNNHFYIGSIYNNNIASNAKDKEQYTKILGEEFNYLQCEWDMSMEAVWVGRHEYNFEWCDKAADFAIAHNMKLRGAHLIWHGNIPDEWDLTALSNSEFEIAVKEYIDTLMIHFMVNYPGLINEWNVVNEVLDHDGIVNPSKQDLDPLYF